MNPATEMERIKISIAATSALVEAHVKQCDERYELQQKQYQGMRETYAALFNKLNDLGKDMNAHDKAMNSRLDRYMIGVIALLIGIITTMLYSGMPWE